MIISYYLNETQFKMMYQVFFKQEPSLTLHQMIHSLVSVLYKRASRQQVEVAALYHIYHLCIEDHFTQARDLLLMLHIQENIQSYDIATVILFNRTMTQLGLAAFRAGLMEYAHNCLDDLVNIGSRNGMIRILIAQGSDSNDEEMQAVQERRKVPPHMVILVIVSFSSRISRLT